MDPTVLQLVLQILMMAMDTEADEEVNPLVPPQHAQAVSRPSVRPPMPLQHQTGGMSRMML